MIAMSSQIISLTFVYLTVYIQEISKLRVTLTGEFPAQRASNAENVFILSSWKISWGMY